MDGVHDMGGMHGFGAVPVDDDAQFHADWERLVYAMVRTVRAQGVYHSDQSRYGIERMDPAKYLGSSYFERWLWTLELNLREKGVLTEAEIEAAHRRALERDDPAEIVPESSDPELAARVREGFESSPDHEHSEPEPRFVEGDRVRVRNIHPEGHTRCPRYVRRATGEVVDVHGAHLFPDAHVDDEDRAEPLYTVAFDADELWGPDAENPDDTMAIDLWEPYLRPADTTEEIETDD